MLKVLDYGVILSSKTIFIASGSFSYIFKRSYGVSYWYVKNIIQFWSNTTEHISLSSQYVWIKLDYSWVFLIYVLPALKKYRCGILINFKIWFSWIHNRFMRVMYDIFLEMYDDKKRKFCWSTHIPT